MPPDLIVSIIYFLKLSSVFHLAIKSAFFDLFAQNFSAVALLCPQNFKQTDQKNPSFSASNKNSIQLLY